MDISRWKKLEKIKSHHIYAYNCWVLGCYAHCFFSVNVRPAFLLCFWVGINVHTYIHTYIQTDRHTYIHTSIHPSMHACMHTYIHTYIHTYRHTDIQTYRHTYIHTYTYLSLLLLKTCSTHCQVTVLGKLRFIYLSNAVIIIYKTWMIGIRGKVVTRG